MTFMMTSQVWFLRVTLDNSSAAGSSAELLAMRNPARVGSAGRTRIAKQNLFRDCYVALLSDASTRRIVFDPARNGIATDTGHVAKFYQRNWSKFGQLTWMHQVSAGSLVRDSNKRAIHCSSTITTVKGIKVKSSEMSSPDRYATIPG